VLKAGIECRSGGVRRRPPARRAAGGNLACPFTMIKTEVFANEHPQTWRLEARTWAQDANAEQIGNALGGLRAKYVMWLLDESGAYPYVRPTGDDGSGLRTAPQNGGGVQSLCRGGRK
jgi:hypothetical protein